MPHNLDIVYCLTSETIDDLGKSVLIDNEGNEPFVANNLLQTDWFYKVLQQYVTGMKVFRVHPRDIARITIDVPPLEEQKRISAIADDITERIANNAKINHHLAATSATDSSPDIRRGKSVSRKAASRKHSTVFAPIFSNKGVTCCV